MIYATVNLTIGDFESVCDHRIVLYRGDKNVEIRFKLIDNRFIVKDSTYAQLIIKRPSAASVFSEPALIENNTVIFTVTEDMIDELKEVGVYSFQIRLYDDNMNARVTLPPCESCLTIDKPITMEGDNGVNIAVVNDSIVTHDETEEDILTEDGQYNKTIWLDGDLITDARLNKIEEALYYINENGGGGGSATAPYISSELPENIIVPTGNNFDLSIDYYSPNFGKGTLKVFINDVETVSTNINQGVSTTVIGGDKLSKGTNRVVVYVIDRVGVMSNSLVFYLRYGSTEITSDFDPYNSYDYGAIIRYYFVPTAVDTSLSLLFYMSIDGTVQTPVSCKSDVRGYFTFPMNLSTGKHYCEAYVIDSENTKSNVLKFNLIILQNNTLVVASDTTDTTIEEGAQLTLDYKVYMKNNSSFITEVYIDNNLVNTGTCGLDFNEYKTSSLTEGTHSIRLVVYDVTRRYSDSIIWTVVVTASTYEMLQPVNAGAIFIGTAVNKSNADERKQYFIGHDQEGNEILGTLTNFAFNSESGWVDDELIISGNSHVEIPIQPLANNAKYGFTLDIEFTSKQIGVPDAEVLTLWNDKTNCGIKITTEKLLLQSSNGNKCDLYFTDNERTHVMFIIDRQELKAKIYLNGVMCEAFHLNDYTVDGVAYLDDFTVNSNIVLGGLNKNGYSKIRNLRVYQVALTTDEIMNNFISCEINKNKQRELVNFQRGDDLPTLYVYCDFSGLGKDDKKPCKIVYNSTNEELYGPSFNLDHKQSQLQYQGTSSMAYPIKNYRLNLRDENGDKWYYTLPTAQPECRFTLKADFMSSGHWTNTGMAKFINDKLYNYNVNDVKSMNPFKWDHVQNGGKVTDFRETISGFPCRLILVNDGETPLNTGQNEPTPGNTKDMGIFNFNNDKDNVTTLGFNSDIFPNCASYEVTANSDTSAGAFISYMKSKNIFKHENAFNGDENHPCEIQIYNGEKVYYAGGSTSGNAAFKIRNCFKENTVYTLQFNYIVPDSVGWTLVYFRYTDGTVMSLGYKGVVNPTFTSNTGKTIEQIDFLNPGTCYIYSDSILLLEGDIPEEGGADELAYLKESFELRHPDEDDVAEDWGFMGVGEEVKIPTIDYFIENGSRRTSQILTDNLNGSITVTSITGTKYALYMYFYDIDGKYLTNIYDFTGVTQSIPNGAYYVSISINDYTEVIINDVTYAIGDDLTGGILNKEPYEKTSIQKAEGTGLKALIDWVDNCTDEEFVRDFEQHFHKDYTLRYFCLVTLIGAVDNLGKNMMLDTADHKIFFPRFYDIDTICSYDNSGQLKFDVDIEMEQGYWNTSSSRLWTRIRDLMHDDIVTTYNNMRQNGVSYENMMKYIYDEQIAKIPQAYYNKDYDVKYAPFADSYIGMAHGDTYEHVKRWLKQRFTFVDTLFDYAPSYNNDILTIRVNTTEEITLHLETYTPVYQHLSWYNGQMDKKKIDGKTSITFSGKVQAATDQEVLIYGGSNIKKISGIQSGNPNRLILGSATKLTELDASNCPLLYEINMNKANLSPHEYLNKVNLSNCPLLEGNLRLNNSPLIQELDIRGTNITGMNLPSSIRNLQVLKLPNTMTELTLNDAGMLHTLEFDEGVKMQSVAMTNCNALTNVVNFDLLQTPSITLNNSYNTAAELYFRDTTNLSLSNMSNLERVIFTPNNEYETFELINVANAPDYKVTTFNCPKLSTFMTTAPYRESYNNYDMTTISETTGTLVYKDFSPNGTEFSKVVPFEYHNDVIEAEIDLTNCDADHTNENILSFAVEENTLSVWGHKSTIHIYYTPSSKTLTFSYKGDTYRINKIITDTIVNIKMDKGTIYLNNEIVLEGSIIESIFSPSTFIVIGSTEGSSRSTALYKLVGVSYNEIDREVKDYGDIQPNTTFTANSIDISSTQFTDVKLLCTTDTNTLKLPTTVKNFYCDSSFDLDTDYLEDGEYDVVHGELVEQYTTDYEGEVYRMQKKQIVISSIGESGYYINNSNVQNTDTNYWTTDFIKVRGGDNLHVCNLCDGNLPTRFIINTYDENKVFISNLVNLYAYNQEHTFTLNDDVMYIRMSANYVTSYATVNEYITPNLVPSSADGSLIFSMYAPSNTVAPASGTWDLHGLEFDNFHTFGMNNDVRPSEDSYTEVNSNVKLFKGIVPNGGVYPNSIMGDVYYNTNASEFVFLMFVKFKPGTHTWSTSTGQTAYYQSDDLNSIAKLSYGTSLTCTADKYIIFPFSAEDQYYIIDDVYYDSNNIEKVYPNSDVASNTLYNIFDYINEISYSDDTIFKYNGASSIIMPSRYDDYNITIKNANISPKAHNTMLYPLLVNEDNPITGTLDYTNYAGKHLSWSFAYTDIDKVQITQPREDLLGSYEYKYNAFYDTEYEFVNPYEIAIYTSSASGVLPTFNTEFTYTYDEKDNGDGTYTTKIYADSLDILPTMIRFENNANLLTVTKLNISKLTGLANLFFNCSNLLRVECTKDWDTSNIKDFDSTFYLCSKLVELDVSNWNVDNSTGFWRTFYGCSSLTTLDLSNWNTSKVNNMSNMFRNCSGLTSLDVSGLDTKNVTDMTSMFQNCTNLTSLDVSGFDTKNVTDMTSMFQNCTNLTSLDVSGFDTGKVTNMSNMFRGCSKLERLKGSFVLNNTNCSYMFESCHKAPDLSEFKMSGTVKDISCMFGDFGLGNTPLATSLDLSDIALTEGCKIGFYTFFRCCVTNIYPFININSHCDLSSITLSQEVLLRFINNLVEVTTSPTLNLGATNLAKLTEDQIAIAANKGWTVA